jgi:hypothetical protein
MRNLAIILALGLCTAGATMAQTATPPSPAPATSTASTPPVTTPPPADAKLPTVTGVELPNAATTPLSEQNKANVIRVSLGDSIVIKTDSAELLGKYLDLAAKQKKEVTLYLNGKDSGIAAEAIDRSKGTLRFHLERNADNKALWSSLLRYPFSLLSG